MIERINKIIKEFDGNVNLYAVDELGNEIGINENNIVETASCIKVFILVEYYRQIMNGEKSRKDILTYNYSTDYEEDGSGIIQYLDDGLSMSSNNLAKLMIILSDNIATDKIINYLGFENINKTIKELGFKHTKLIARKLNFNEYNEVGKTTAYEYARIYKMILNAEILNRQLCDEIIEILSNQVNKEMLIKKMPQEYLHQKSVINYIASKSGSLEGENPNTINCRNNGGIISTNVGNYIVSIFTSDFSDHYYYNDNQAIVTGAKINSIIFEEFYKNKGSFKNNK